MGQHGHQRRYAMAGAVDHAKQTAVVVGAIDIEVTTNDIARPPQHRMAIAHGADQLPVRQDRALDEAGVIDGVVDLLVCRGHVPVGLFRVAGALAYAVLQLAGVAAHLLCHGAEGCTELADLILAMQRQRRVTARPPAPGRCGVAGAAA